MLNAVDSNVVIKAVAHTVHILLLIPYAADECLAQGSYVSGVIFHYASLLIALQTGRIPTRQQTALEKDLGEDEHLSKLLAAYRLAQNNYTVDIYI